MALPIFHVDAFTSVSFRGNPAAVCLLDRPREERWMKSVAAELNLSETAFVAPGAEAGVWNLRWFTPTVEVPLCGHATLASAHILWETAAVAPGAAARFDTRSGRLVARQLPKTPVSQHAPTSDSARAACIEIDLPAYPVTAFTPPDALAAALGAPRILFCGRTADRTLGDVDFLIELESEEVVRALRPDFGRLGREVAAGVIATARAANTGARAEDRAPAPIAYDFVSRYFAPAFGIDEDPVTGAAHCALAPFWSSRLGRDGLVGYQASARGGFVRTRVSGERALLSGEAVTVIRGTLVE